MNTPSYLTLVPKSPYFKPAPTSDFLRPRALVKDWGCKPGLPAPAPAPHGIALDWFWFRNPGKKSRGPVRRGLSFAALRPGPLTADRFWNSKK
jgi:hypothetical protein